MEYEIALEYIPMTDDRTIVLAGMYLLNSSYAIKIGLFPGEMPRESRSMVINTPDQFQHLRLIHQVGESSIFDLITPIARISSADVKFSDSERFANGTEEFIKSFDLRTVLRTILPHDGGVSVLQFMVKRHGQAIGLTTFNATDRYVSTVYDTIGGPLIEDKK